MESNDRKTKIKSLAAGLLIVVAISGLSSFVVARLVSGQKEPVENPDWAVESFLMKNVGFDGAQMMEYRELKAEFDRQTFEIRMAMHQAMDALLRETASENADLAAIDSLSNAFGAYQAALKRETMRHMLQIKQLCRPGQRETFNSMLNAIERRGMGRGRGMGKGLGKGLQQGNPPSRFENPRGNGQN